MAKGRELTPDQVAWLSAHIAQIPNLPVRTSNCLDDHGIQTVEELLMCCPDKLETCTRGPDGMPCGHRHLRDLPNFGDKTLEIVYECLAAIGFER